MDIQKIIAENKSRQQEAKRLNVRAGEALFKVFSFAELTAWVMERLAGARRLAEIVNLTTLALPDLDRDLVKKVLTDNPDKITVLGREVAVEYSSYRLEPVIRIDFRGEQSRDWARIPTEGIRLPGGREVFLVSAVDGYGYYIETLSSQFITKVREIFGKKQWENFVSSADKPTISIPDPADLSAQIPAVCEHQYGVCVGTEQPLIAFGVVTYTSDSYWSSDKFETKWFAKRDEAEVEWAKSVEAYGKKQTELREKAEKESGDIREVMIDRRGTAHRPELNGRRIDNPSSFEFTPDYFWHDLQDLVREFGRGLNAFAIYRGDSPLLVYLNREKIEAVLPKVRDLIKVLASNPDSEEKENFWRKLEEFRTKETAEGQMVRQEIESREYARQEAERVEMEQKELEARTKKKQADAKIGLTSIGDAFARFGL